MKKHIQYFIFLIFITSGVAYSQVGNYRVAIEPKQIQGMPGIQSFVWAQWDGYWLIIGGRKDGLHRRQPFASFLASGNNINIYVVHPDNHQIWSTGISSLNTTVQEQIQSTNMEFHQIENKLYIVGGYGYSASLDEHITHPNMTIVDVPNLIQAIINQQNISNYFRQITDQRMAVTGGHLEHMNNQFYLVCGQRFDGLYNPMGPNNGPGFSQKYSNEIRKFILNDNGNTFSIDNYTAIKDTVHLHRRDYNLTPGYHSQQEELIIWSGVFQYGVNLPYLYPVEINGNGYNPAMGFNQYLSHYHSACFALYDSINNTSYTLFFGGISQYYPDANGNLIQDADVPFVKTVSMVKKDASGNYSEHQLPIQMPAYLGAGAEFIPNPELKTTSNGVCKLNSLTADSVLLGYIVGGIRSSAANIFFINDGTQSIADTTITKVWLVNDPFSTTENLVNTQKKNIHIFPNPVKNKFHISIDGKIGEGPFNIQIKNINGSIVETRLIKEWINPVLVETINLKPGTYIIEILSKDQQWIEKLMIH